MALKYVAAFRAGDTAWGVRDPARVRQALGADCRRAIADGKWPGLARTMVGLAASDDQIRAEVCEIAPPEALAAVAEWQAQATTPRTYETACDVALLRGRRGDFERIVAPRLLETFPDRMFSDRAARLGERLRPEERTVLLPALAASTAERAAGRDRLFSIVCAAAPARSAPACQDSSALEPEWARQDHVHRLVPRLLRNLAPALAYMILVVLVWRRARRDPLVTGASALGTAAALVALVWLTLDSPAPGGGPLSVLGAAWATIVTPFAALAGALIGWCAVRFLELPPGPWCLAQVSLYALFSVIRVLQT